MQFLSTASEIEQTLGQLIRRCDQLSLAVAWASRNTRCCDLLLKNQHKIEAAIVGTHFYQTDPEFIADFYMHPKVRFQLKPPRTGLEPATRWLTAYWKPDDLIGFCSLEKDFSGAIGPEIDGDPSRRRFTLSCAG